MKIGVGYNSLYGKRFIRKSCEYMRQYCSFIVVVHQSDTDYENMYDELIDMKADNLIDEIINVDSSSTINELILKKRNIALDVCRQNGCTHFIPLDTDEIVDKSIVNVIDDNIDTYYSKIINYYDYDRMFFDWYYVQSLLKIDNRHFEMCGSSHTCDPLRVMTEQRYVLLDGICMHHNSVNLYAIMNKINHGVIRCQTIIDQLQTVKTNIENKSKDIMWFNGGSLSKYDEIFQERLW